MKHQWVLGCKKGAVASVLLVVGVIAAPAFADESSPTGTVMGRKPAIISLQISGSSVEDRLDFRFPITHTYTFFDPDGDVEKNSSVVWTLVDSLSNVPLDKFTVNNNLPNGIPMSIMLGKVSPRVKVCVTPKTDPTTSLPSSGTEYCTERSLRTVNKAHFISPKSAQNNSSIDAGGGQWKFLFTDKGISPTLFPNSCRTSMHGRSDLHGTFGEGYTLQRGGCNNEQNQFVLSSNTRPNEFVFFVPSVQQANILSFTPPSTKNVDYSGEFFVTTSKFYNNNYTSTLKFKVDGNTIHSYNYPNGPAGMQPKEFVTTLNFNNNNRVDVEWGYPSYAVFSDVRIKLEFIGYIIE